jgi:hypothetical protein
VSCVYFFIVNCQTQKNTPEMSLKSRSVNFFEIDKNVTNVTIKDAPCELSDQFKATHMSKYGQVIHGSIKGGVIKGTNIENGTRYIQILYCAPILPVVVYGHTHHNACTIYHIYSTWLCSLVYCSYNKFLLMSV